MFGSSPAKTSESPTKANSVSVDKIEVNQTKTESTPSKIEPSPSKVTASPMKAATPNKLAGLMGEALLQKSGLDLGLNKSSKMYSSEQILQIKEILKDFIHFYGYTDAERRLTGKINPTGFFSCKTG